MQFQFDCAIAEKYGVESAIVISNMAFWIKKNAANGRHIYDGNVWTYNSMKAFTELFPFWTVSQVRRILDNLEKDGAILKSNYNENTYDRTLWYALSPAVLQLLNLYVYIDKCICQNQQMELSILANRNANSDNSIKEQIINTDNKTQIGTAMEFLQINSTSTFEVFLMKYKSQIADWEAFEIYFNSVVVEEEKKWETGILIARIERLASAWIRNNNKHRNVTATADGPSPLRTIFKA